MIVIDTTVLCYAVGGDHRLREPCRAVIAAAGRLRATTTVEVIQEFTHVCARRRSRAEAAEYAERFATALAPLLVTDVDDLRAGLGLFRDHARLGAFDCILAGAARRREAGGLISADAAFGDVPGLRTIDPADEAGIQLLMAA